MLRQISKSKSFLRRKEYSSKTKAEEPKPILKEKKIENKTIKEKPAKKETVASPIKNKKTEKTQEDGQ